MQELHENPMLEDVFYGSLSREKSKKDIALHYISQLNADQKQAFERIAASVNGQDSQKLFFVEGSGGTGKILYCFRLYFFREILSVQWVNSMVFSRQTELRRELPSGWAR